MRSSILLTILLCLPVAVAATPSHHDYSRYTHWTDSFLDTGEALTAVAPCDINGVPCLAVTSQTVDLTLFTVSGETVTEAGSLAFAGAAVDVAFDGNTAYVVSEPNRLAQVPVFVPEAPSLAWQVTLPHTPEAVAMAGSHVLVACGADGLLVFDPTVMFGSPVGVVASWSGVAHDIVMSGDMAVLLTDSGITLVDVSDPLNPAQRGSFTVTDSRSLAVTGTMAYVGRKALPDTGGRVQELDIADPDNITAGRSFTGLGTHDITALDPADDLLITAGSKDLEFIDLVSGTVVWNGVGMSFPQAVGHVGDVVGLGTLLDGFHIYARRDLAYPPASPVFGMGDIMRGLQVDGSYAFGHAGGTIYCFDLTPAVPVLAWTETPTDPDAFVTRMMVADGTIYAGYLSGEVRILSHDGVAATELGAFTAGPTTISGFGLLGADLAVLIDPVDDGYIQTEVHIYDVSDPAAPLLLDTYRNDSYRNMLASGSSIALCDNSSNGNGIQLLDASDPANLVEAVHLVTDPLPRVSRQGDVLYILMGKTLRPVDISDPWSPQYGPLRKVPGGNGFLADGSAGYLAGMDLVFDLSDPLNPVPVGSVSTPQMQGALLMGADDGYLVLGLSDDNVLLGTQSPAASPAIRLPRATGGALDVQASPNPFNPRVRLSFTMSAPGHATVEIFDLAGRKVANLGGYFAEPGPAVFDWDGRSDSGRDLPSGIYLVRAADDLGSGARKIALVR